MASEAIVLIDLIPLACIIISLGCLLIDRRLDGAMDSVYGDRETITGRRATACDGVRRRATTPPTQAAMRSRNRLAVQNPYT